MTNVRRYRGPLVKRLDEEINETPPLKISNRQDVNALLDYIRLIETHLANGRGTLTVAAASSLLLAVCQANKMLDTTGQTSQLLTTTKGTYIVFVTDATTVGTLPITHRTTGLSQQLAPTLRNHKQKKKKEGQS